MTALAHSQHDSIVTAQSLSVLKEQAPILKNVSFSIVRGERVAVIGPEKSGKSTFLNCLAGAIKTTSGKLEIHGRVIRVKQKPALIGCKTVLENILHGMINRKSLFSMSAGSLDRKKIETLAEVAGLSNSLDSLVSEISDLDRFKTAIIRASLQKADLILLDEFSEEIDRDAYRELLSLACTLNSNPETTIIAVVPDYELAHEFSTRMLAFEKGVLLYDTSSDSPWYELAKKEVEESSSGSLKKEKARHREGRYPILMPAAVFVFLLCASFAMTHMLSSSEQPWLSQLAKGLFETLLLCLLVTPSAFLTAWIANTFIAQTRSRVIREYAQPFFLKIRTVPALLWAALIAASSIDSFAGACIALFIPSFLYLFSELYQIAGRVNQSGAIELRELGASKSQQYLLAIWPYAKKRSARSFLKSLARNMSDATLIGLCGLVGVGQVILHALQTQQTHLLLLSGIVGISLHFLALWVRSSAYPSTSA